MSAAGEAERERLWRVEPRGIEPVAAAQRHGRPTAIFGLWVGANVEFTTLVTGALGVGLFGLGFAPALIAIVAGTLLGALALGALTTLGPRLGVPQLIQSRRAFGFCGNYLPAGLNFIAGIGWFAVNTVLGVLALVWLAHTGFAASLGIVAGLQILCAVYGYNWIHAFERCTAVVLVAVFLAVSVYALPQIHFASAADAHAPLWSGASGSFLLTLGVSLSYILGWIAFSSDYTRYLPAETPPARSFWPAFWGIVVSCVWLEALGAGLATLHAIALPTDLVTGLLPQALAVPVMVAVVLGTISANVLNIYSGSLSILAVDTRFVRAVFPRRWVAVLIVGIAGAALSLAGEHGYYAGYEDFLLLLAYWVAPWLGVVLVDFFVLGGRLDPERLYERRPAFAPGLAAWAAGIVASVPFFNQTLYVGPLAHAWPGLGDISYYVGCAVAALVYYLSARARRAAVTV